MKEINFYHLTTTTLERALPKLLEKVYQSGKRAVVFTNSENRAEEINKLLWTYSTNRFLPHGTKQDGFVEDQPVFITSENENPNKSEIAVAISGLTPSLESFNRLLDIFDGNNPEELANAKERWKDYKAKGFSLSYLKQDAEGKWEKQEAA